MGRQVIDGMGLLPLSWNGREANVHGHLSRHARKLEDTGRTIITATTTTEEHLLEFPTS